MASKNKFVLLILLLAAAVRLWGIQWGLPHEYQSEEYKIVKYALRMGSGDLNPHFFEYPTLYLYFMLFVYGIYFAVGYVVGWFPTSADFALHFVKDPTMFYLLGRLSEAVCGVLIVFMVYKIGKRMFSETAGLVSAAIVAGLPHYIYLSHIIKGYMGMTVLLLIFFWFCIDIAEEGGKKYYVLAGIFLGLAVSTRYHAAPYGIALIAAHLLRKNPKENLWNLAIALALIPTFFFIGSPYALLSFKEFWTEFGSNMSIYSSLTGEKPNYFHNAMIMLNRFLTLGDVPAPKIAGAACIAGFGMCFIKWERKYFLILAPLAAYLWIVGGYHNPAGGYLIQIFPLFILLGVHGLLIAGEKWGKAIPIFIFAAVLGWNAYEGSAMAYSFTVPDTRTEAKEWIDKNIPEGSAFLIDLKVMAPPLLMSYEEIERFHKKAVELNHYKKEYFALQLKAHPGPGHGYQIFTLKRDFREIASLPKQVEEVQKLQDLAEVSGDIAALKKMGIQYVAVSEDTEKDAILKNLPGISDFYRNLPKNAVMLEQFSPHFRIAHSGKISIYKL